MSDPTNVKPSRIGAAVNRLDVASKLARNLIFAFGVLAYLWVTFFGAGFQKWFQDYAGTTEVLEKVRFLEDHMTPPKVLNWETNRVLGVCRAGDCMVEHEVSRTSYGATCGLPIARAEIRVNGRISDLKLPNFEEVEATQRGRRIVVPLGIDRFVPAGSHEYRFINVYPSCPWAREPIPRVGPWFDLLVSE